MSIYSKKHVAKYPTTLTSKGKVAREIERRAMLTASTNDTRKKRRVLIKLALRDGLCCAYCKEPLKFIWMTTKKQRKNKEVRYRLATFDHILAAKYGGKVTVKNGLLSCKLCNSRKGHMHIDEFMALNYKHPFFSKSVQCHG